MHSDLNKRKSFIDVKLGKDFLHEDATTSVIKASVKCSLLKKKKSTKNIFSTQMFPCISYSDETI